MFRNILTDLTLYWRLVGIQIRSQFQYKLNLAFEFITYFCIMALEFVALLLFFVPFPTLLGWRIGEVALLAAIISISFGLAELFGSGLDAFSKMIRLGEFDRVLLRPVGALLQVMGYDFVLRRLGRVSQGILAFGVALYFLPNLQWTSDKVLVLLLGILSGTLIFIAILLIGATICFWSIETVEITNLLFYGGREMMSYPISIYDQVLQRIFTFLVPIAFGSYIPTCYILGKSLPFDLPVQLAFASPLAALCFLLVAWLLWGIGVHHYQSTGS